MNIIDTISVDINTQYPLFNFKIDKEYFIITENNEIKTKSGIPLLNEPLLRSRPHLKIDDEYKKGVYKPRTDTSSSDQIFTCIEKIIERDESISVDFVCASRSVMTKICSFPRERFESNKFAVIKVNDCLFLFWYGEPEKLTDENEKNSYCGYRFEKIMTTKEEELTPGLRDGAFDLTVASSFQSPNGINHKLFYKGEVDGRDEKGQYIEIKTRLNEIKRHHRIKWWLQSYLIGVKRIIVGMKNDNFLVTEIKDIPISQVVTNKRDSNQSISFGGYFLSRLKEIMENFKEYEICIVDLDPKYHRITFSKTNKDESNEYYFLTDEFITLWKNK